MTVQAAASESRARVLGTLVGLIAVLIWSTGGPVYTFVSNVPPLQMIALTFVQFILVMLPIWRWRREPIRQKFQLPLKVWIIGILGPWGYTICFFFSYAMIPPVDASLLLLSWPILLLVGNAALRGRRIRWWHALGAIGGFSGAAILVIGRSDGDLGGGGPLFGYLIAFGGALAFAAYNLGRSSWTDVPTDAAALFCFGGAGLSAILHLLFETTVMPDATAWGAILVLGLFNTAAALFAWDFAVKHGHVRALVSLSYMIPLFTALLLIGIGASSFTLAVGIACALIIGGAFIGSRDLFMKNDPAG
jgi:drug/metabolite transporter (DMT)-like permease